MNMIVQWAAVTALLGIVIWIVVRKTLGLLRSHGKRPCSGCPSAHMCALHNEVPERCSCHPRSPKNQPPQADKTDKTDKADKTGAAKNQSGRQPSR